jgi:predicted membrane protein
MLEPKITLRSTLNDLKSPFSIIAILLLILFFIPLSSDYNAMKIIMGIIVITYGINQIVYKTKHGDSEKPEVVKNRMEEVEKALDNMKM